MAFYLPKVTSAGIQSYVEQTLKETGMVDLGQVQLLMKHFAKCKSADWLLPLGQNLLLLSQFIPVKPYPPLIMVRKYYTVKMSSLSLSLFLPLQAVPDGAFVDRDKLSQKLITVLTSLSLIRQGEQLLHWYAWLSSSSGSVFADGEQVGTRGEWFVSMVTYAQVCCA